MRNWTLAAAAITLAAIAPTEKAAALPAATTWQLGLADGTAATPEKTVLVCDPWRCSWQPGYWGYDRLNPYWSWRRHYWWGGQRPLGSAWGATWGDAWGDAWGRRGW
jgi:hypothetical protein